jgi:hypothetical protein
LEKAIIVGSLLQGFPMMSFRLSSRSAGNT